MIINLLYKLVATSRISTYYDPKKEKRKRGGVDLHTTSCKRNDTGVRKNNGDNKTLRKKVRIAGSRRDISRSKSVTLTPNPSVKSAQDGDKVVTKFIHLESIVDQSLRLKQEIFKELDSGMDLNLKEIGFVEPP